VTRSFRFEILYIFALRDVTAVVTIPFNRLESEREPENVIGQNPAPLFACFRRFCLSVRVRVEKANGFGAEKRSSGSVDNHVVYGRRNTIVRV